MAITSTTNFWEYDGDDSTILFGYGQPIQSESDLEVILTDAYGVQTTLVLNTDYSVNGVGSEESGDWEVSYPIASGVDPLPTGASLRINLKTLLTTNTDIETLTTNSGVAIQKAIDKLSLQDLSQQRQIDALAILDVSEAVTECNNAAGTASEKADEAAESAVGAAESADEAAASADEAAESAASIEYPITIEHGGTGQTTAPLARAALEAAGTSQTFSKELQVSYVSNGTIRLMVNTPVITLTSLSAICDSGTCTATFYIDGVAVTTGALSVSSTIATVTPTALNVTASGSIVTVVITSNSACLNMAITAQYTQTLS